LSPIRRWPSAGNPRICVMIKLKNMSTSKFFQKKTHALLGLTSSSSFSFSGMETIIVGLVLEVFEEFDDDLEGNRRIVTDRV